MRTIAPEMSIPTHGDTLDCGHTLNMPERLQPGSECGGTGYARDRENQTYCYACADDREREALKTAQTFFAYLHRPSDTVRAENARAGMPTQATLTTWTGGLLARVTYLARGRHNIGGGLYRFRAIDVHGQHWYGTSPGPGMYARMRRARRPLR